MRSEKPPLLNANKLPFRIMQPFFYAGLLDDPLLWLRNRLTGRSFLVDCGNVTHLPKHVMKSIDALFISHAHMDHFMGIDFFTRSNIASPRPIDLFGPPDISQRLKNKLQGYDWNLSQEYYCWYRVHEIFPNFTQVFHLPGAKGFSCSQQSERIRSSAIIHQCPWVTVEAAQGEHKIPVMIYKFTERPEFSIDSRKIERFRLIPGPWINELKQYYLSLVSSSEPLKVTFRNGAGQSEERFVEDPLEFYQTIKKELKPLSIGYVTDIGFTEKNIETLVTLLKDVTLLVCECTFLKEKKSKARETFHLCSEDLNVLVRELNPRFLMPIHLSKFYLGSEEQLYQELNIPEDVRILKIPPRLTPPPILPSEIDCEVG